MYNRYIPQPDGSYRRSRVPDNHPHQPNPAPPPEKPCIPDEKPCAEPPTCQQDVPRKQSACRPACRGQGRNQKLHSTEKKHEQTDTSVSGFLKNLLPKDFDTGDLLIVLLLLLMSGDCAEDQNSALLTLALYLFM